MKKIEKFRSILFAFLILGGCMAVWGLLSNRSADPSYEHTERLHGVFPPHPVINSSPSAFLIIEGEHPAGVETQIKIDYMTFSPDCGAYTLDYFNTGDKDVQAVSDTYTIPLGTTSINLHIALDKYEAGKCNWQPVRVWGSTAEPTTKKDQRIWSLITNVSNSGATVGEQIAWCRSKKNNGVQIDEYYCTWHFPGTLASTGSKLKVKFSQVD